MTNLIGYLKKILLLSISLVILFALPSHTYASNSLITSANISYNIGDTGDLDTLIDLTITTDSSIPTVLNYYTAVLPFEQIDQISVEYLGKTLERTIHKQSSGSDVVIKFDNAIISKTTPLNFKIRLNVEEYVTVSDSKVINLPMNFSDIIISKITANYPKDWGETVWTSIGQMDSSEGSITITPNNEASISIIFGEGLGYSFNINKTLQNFDVNDIKYEISVPMDNYYQDIIFENISPPPFSTHIDNSGNTFLIYTVAPGDTVDISINGFIIIVNEANVLNNQEDLVKQIGYWDIDDEKEFLRFNIYNKNKSLDMQDQLYTELTEIQQKVFLKNTYDYVINRLTLSDSAETYLRAGADNVLKNISNVSVEDYSDLTIALLREYNIPSRMMLGYIPKSSGYKDEGFYHTWIEVWDITEGKWSIWDPALEELSGKRLYNSSHLDHITFHVREKDPLSPNLTYFADEELSINPISSFSDSIKGIEVSEISSTYNFINRSSTVQLTVTNSGNTIIKDLNIPHDSGKVLSDNNLSISPGESVTMKILLEDIAEDTDKNLSINYDDNIDSISVSIETNKFWWWDYMLITISLAVFSGIILTGNYIKNLKKK